MFMGFKIKTIMIGETCKKKKEAIEKRQQTIKDEERETILTASVDGGLLHSIATYMLYTNIYIYISVWQRCVCVCKIYALA